MLSIIRNFIRKLSANLSTDGLRNTPKTNSSFPIKGRPNTDHAYAFGSIKNKRGNRLGFMEGEGRVPDDFNTMCASKVESMFYENK